jgi:hypothetical protein
MLSLIPGETNVSLTMTVLEYLSEAVRLAGHRRASNMACGRTISCSLALLIFLSWADVDSPAAEPVDDAAVESTDGGIPEAMDDAPSETVQQGCAIDKPFVPLSEITAGLQLDLTQIPTDCSKDLFSPPRPSGALFASTSQFHWQPSNFFHQPLYFDDTPLERYGQSLCPCVQPVISGVRFFITIPAIPYKIGVDHTCDCVTTLGKYRPGSCAPCMKEVLPLCDLDGALLTAGTAVVLALCLP